MQTIFTIANSSLSFVVNNTSLNLPILINSILTIIVGIIMLVAKVKVRKRNVIGLIIVGMIGIITSYYQGRSVRFKREKTNSTICCLSQRLRIDIESLQLIFKNDTFRLYNIKKIPLKSAEISLNKIIKEKEKCCDAWQTPIKLKVSTINNGLKYEFLSAGADKKFNTEDDITSKQPNNTLILNKDEVSSLKKSILALSNRNSNSVTN